MASSVVLPARNPAGMVGIVICSHGISLQLRIPVKTFESVFARAIGLKFLTQVGSLPSFWMGLVMDSRQLLGTLFPLHISWNRRVSALIFVTELRTTVKFTRKSAKKLYWKQRLDTHTISQPRTRKPLFLETWCLRLTSPPLNAHRNALTRASTMIWEGEGTTNDVQSGSYLKYVTFPSLIILLFPFPDPQLVVCNQDIWRCGTDFSWTVEGSVLAKGKGDKPIPCALLLLIPVVDA